MLPARLLLSALLLLSSCCSLSCLPVCVSRCCRLVENFPSRLRKLRENYIHIQDFYEANDDLDTSLLDSSVEVSFTTPFACQAMDSLLGFYLQTVLPTALAEVTRETRNLMPHVESIQQIFNILKGDVNACRHHFACRNQFDIRTLNSTYTQMESQGLYKAMGELNLLFNFFETFLASKRNRGNLA
ncbi:interleukin-10 [Nelusetta ayraudi]|uniref:interleukin-10 n=1 Tax=Nelusetta ayraudi TaxID=303726 RepID=UPI003F7156DF